MKISRDWSIKELGSVGWIVWEGIEFWEVEKRSDWRIWRKEEYREFGRYEKKISFGRSEARPQCNGHGQAQGDEEVLQLWRNRSSRCKVLQTKEREKRESEDGREGKGRFFLGQEVSTNSPALVDSKVQLPDEVMKDFLDYFGARKYETNIGYSIEWVAKKIQWSNKEEALGILKVWAYSSREEECTKRKLKELNEMMDDEVLMALKTLEEPLVLRKMGDKQLNVWVKLSTTDTHWTFYKQALVDSGSSSSCISRKFVKENLINTHQLLFPITCYNADGSTNKDESITEVVKMNITISDYQELIQLLVTNLSNHNLFLGYDWLQKHNPTINWKDSSISLQNCRQ